MDTVQPGVAGSDTIIYPDTVTRRGSELTVVCVPKGDFMNPDTMLLAFWTYLEGPIFPSRV